MLLVIFIRCKLIAGVAALILVAQSFELRAAGAGVLVSTERNNQVYVLLADHKKPSQITRGWSTLGGTIKGGESELQAAVREVVEESGGVLSAELLFSTVNPEVKTMTPGFTIFYAQVPFQNVDSFNLTEVSINELGNSERGPFIWLPWSEVLAAAKKYREQLDSDSRSKVILDKKFLPENSQTDWFFDAFLATVKSISETSHTKLYSLKPTVD